MKTRLTEILGVEHPVMLAGMGGVAYWELTAAVSEAGGYGCLGAATMSMEEMIDELKKAREATSKPFGADLLTAMPGNMIEQVEKIIEGGASSFVAGLGVPVDVIELCHKHGLLVISMCGKVEHARRAVAAGCDIVVAQGTEAGGHTGRIATMPLVPQVVDAVAGEIPVVAAGGIFDGRGLAAALALGADGVWVGTRFIGTPEARTVGGYKDALLAKVADDTVVTRAFTGKTLRAIRNSYTDYFESHPDELQPFPAQAARSVQDGAMHLGLDEAAAGIDPDKECYPAGQAIGAIGEIVPAGEIVRRFVTEAEEVIDRMASVRSAV